MQGPSAALEDRLEGTADPGLPAMSTACSDALAAERQVWRLHSEISELALLTRRLFSAPEVREGRPTPRRTTVVAAFASAVPPEKGACYELCFSTLGNIE